MDTPAIEFYKSARHNKVLEEKTTLMVHLAAAMAVGCYPCMQYYLEQADDVALSEDEISAVETIVMAVSGGRVMMQFDDVLTKGGGDGCKDEDTGCPDD